MKDPGRYGIQARFITLGTLLPRLARFQRLRIMYGSLMVGGHAPCTARLIHTVTLLLRLALLTRTLSQHGSLLTHGYTRTQAWTKPLFRDQHRC